MKKLFFAIFAIALLMASNGVFAQADGPTDNHLINIAVPEIAILDIEPSANTTIALTPTFSGEAGDPLVFGQTDNTLWLNYTSVVTGSQNARRTITAVLDATVPGLDIKVTPGAVTGGHGNRGASEGTTTLSNSALTVITSIGTCYTETGTNKGHQLVYELGLTGTATYGNIVGGITYSPIVTYTITDDVTP